MANGPNVSKCHVSMPAGIGQNGHYSQRKILCQRDCLVYLVWKIWGLAFFFLVTAFPGLLLLYRFGCSCIVCHRFEIFLYLVLRVLSLDFWAFPEPSNVFNLFYPHRCLGFIEFLALVFWGLRSNFQPHFDTSNLHFFLNFGYNCFD